MIACIRSIKYIILNHQVDVTVKLTVIHKHQRKYSSVKKFYTKIICIVFPNNAIPNRTFFFVKIMFKA